ncbi:MAG: type III-B CRISPR module-associated protein Cmr5 [Thermoleophilia bacterium]|jgi:CRISPR-associated protein Cmr5
MSQSLDQRRAKHAWDVMQAAKTCEDWGQVKKLPVRILSCGLVQSLAVLNAKGKSEALLSAIGDWILNKRKNPASTAEPPSPDKFISDIINEDSIYLRWATNESLAYLQWLVRFAKLEAESEGLTSGD